MSCIHSAYCWFGTVLNNLAVNYDKSGQLEKAIKAYENVVEMHTGDPETPPLSLSVCKYDTLLSVLKYQP